MANEVEMSLYDIAHTVTEKLGIDPGCKVVGVGGDSARLYRRLQRRWKDCPNFAEDVYVSLATKADDRLDTTRVYTRSNEISNFTELG